MEWDIFTTQLRAPILIAKHSDTADRLFRRACERKEISFHIDA